MRARLCVFYELFLKKKTFVRTIVRKLVFSGQMQGNTFFVINLALYLMKKHLFGYFRKKAANETNMSNFHTLKVVGRGSETQLQMSKN